MGTLSWDTVLDAEQRIIHRLHDDHDGWIKPSVVMEIVAEEFPIGFFHVVTDESGNEHGMFATLDAARDAAEVAYYEAEVRRAEHAAEDYDGQVYASLPHDDDEVAW